MSELPCIYCCTHNSSIGTEHIIPESLGCKETLPPGYVCDDCNNYFGCSLDKSVFHNREIALYLGTQQIPGKKGNPRITIGNRLSFHEKGHFSLELSCIATTNGQMVFAPKQDNEFDELYFARGIHKIAFNSFASRWGHLAALHPRYCQLRKYIRQPIKDELWTYAVKKSQGTGEYLAVFYNTKQGEVNRVGLRLLCLDFIVSLTGWNREIENEFRKNGFYIINKKGQWDNNSILGLQNSGDNIQNN